MINRLDYLYQLGLVPELSIAGDGFMGLRFGLGSN